jgi:hypothetical protein
LVGKEAGKSLQLNQGRISVCAVCFISEYGLETQGELRKALGPMVYLPDTPNGAKGDDKGCLCWVDVKALAERAGLVARFDGMDWLVTKD